MFASSRTRLLTHVKDHIKDTEEEKVQKVLEAIDKFPNKNSLCILTADLGSILDKVVEKFDPKVALELGLSCGCSAIRIASKMAKPNSKLLTIQAKQEGVDTAKNIIEWAGLNEKVDVGTLNELDDHVTKFLKDNGARCFDFIFLHHYTGRYLRDLLFLQKKGVLGKGTVIVANTMGFRWCQDYLKHLKDHPEELQTETYKSESGKANMTVSVCIVD
jgi:predicted O-methyltransferase YrrM